MINNSKLVLFIITLYSDILYQLNFENIFSHHPGFPSLGHKISKNLCLIVIILAYYSLLIWLPWKQTWLPWKQIQTVVDEGGYNCVVFVVDYRIEGAA